MKRYNLTTITCTTIVALFLLTGLAFAEEWQYNGNIYTQYSNVGIGTTDPEQKLHINGNYPWLLLTGGDNGFIGLRAYSAAPHHSNIFFDNRGDLWLASQSYDNRGSGIGESVRMLIRGNTGNVGIGTTNPGTKLQISGSRDVYTTGQLHVVDSDSGRGIYIGRKVDGAFINSHIYDELRLQENGRSLYIGGNVGIGTMNPGAKLDVHGDAHINSDLKVDHQLKVYGGTYGGISLGSTYYYETAPNNGMIIQGNVGIGTTNPGNYKLAVEGKIGAREVVVTEASWSDYIFDDQYKLPSLVQVEAYIKENKHLPDIPSAKEIKEKGLSVSDMLAKQMQKIEELTLYLIELKKENMELRKGNEELSSCVISLEKAYKKLTQARRTK